jgi:hypothetical protein
VTRKARIFGLWKRKAETPRELISKRRAPSKIFQNQPNGASWVIANRSFGQWTGLYLRLYARLLIVLLHPERGYFAVPMHCLPSKVRTSPSTPAVEFRDTVLVVEPIV